MESSQYQTAPQFQDLNACSYDDNGEPLESLDLFLQLFNEPSPSSQFLDLEGDFSAERYTSNLTPRQTATAEASNVTLGNSGPLNDNGDVNYTQVPNNYYSAIDRDSAYRDDDISARALPNASDNPHHVLDNEDGFEEPPPPSDTLHDVEDMISEQSDNDDHNENRSTYRPLGVINHNDAANKLQGIRLPNHITLVLANLLFQFLILSLWQTITTSVATKLLTHSTMHTH